jgi:hypothetical protein
MAVTMMLPSGMLRRVDLLRTDDSEERTASIIRVTTIDELGTTLAANVSSSPILVTLMFEALLSSETSVLRRVTLRNIPEDGILNAQYVSKKRCYNIYEVCERIIW